MAPRCGSWWLMMRRHGPTCFAWRCVTRDGRSAQQQTVCRPCVLRRSFVRTRSCSTSCFPTSMGSKYCSAFERPEPRCRCFFSPQRTRSRIGSPDSRRAGGDDYVTKPFSLEEVVARLRGLIRRSTLTLAQAKDPVLTVGDLSLNEDSYEVMRGEHQIDLTVTEFELLRFLMRNPRRVLSKAQILDRVWSYDFSGRESVVELYISSLRKKVDGGRAPMIHTVRGAGYLLKAVGCPGGVLTRQRPQSPGHRCRAPARSPGHSRLRRSLPTIRGRLLPSFSLVRRALGTPAIRGRSSDGSWSSLRRCSWV